MDTYSYKSKLASTGKFYMVAEKSYHIDGRKRYNHPELLADFIGNEIGLRYEAEEYVYIICLNSANHIIGLFEASHGGADASLFPVREICKKALMLNAINIVITHNHPSGNIEPSTQDISATKRIKQATDIIGMNVLDHIIVGGNTYGYYSFLENGLLKKD